MIDALAHLDLYPTPDDAARDLDAADALGVTDVISAGTDPRAEEFVPTPARGPRVHRAFGLHPAKVIAEDLDAQLSALERKLDRAIELRGDGRPVALGECGLDARDGMPDLDLQERAFRAQIDLARRRDLTLIVHGVRCPARILAVMRSARATSASDRARWIWHGFGESFEIAREACALGAVLSIGALVLKPNAARVRDAVARIREPVLLETDAPDVSLTTIAAVAAEVAHLRACAIDDVVARAAALARDVFALDDQRMR